MLKRVCLCLFGLTFLGGCGSPPQELRPETVTAPALSFQLATWPIAPAGADALHPLRVYKENVQITIYWSTLATIQQMAQADGYENWDHVHGLAYTMMDQCLIYAEEPESYSDVLRLYILGHELLHCWGWPPHS